jgi:hypothetical protein
MFCFGNEFPSGLHEAFCFMAVPEFAEEFSRFVIDFVAHQIFLWQEKA